MAMKAYIFFFLQLHIAQPEEELIVAKQLVKVGSLHFGCIGVFAQVLCEVVGSDPFFLDGFFEECEDKHWVGDVGLDLCQLFRELGFRNLISNNEFATKPDKVR